MYERMQIMKRIFLIVLDSFGIGEMEDAASYGDVNVNTLRAVSSSPYFHMPNMGRMGLFDIDGVTVGEKTGGHTGAVARMAERSRGKDTTIGHWEIAGIYSPRPLPVYPQGFPAEVLEPFMKMTGRGVLCNRPFSGTAVIQEYGDAHRKTGDLIVYTSADSVFQIAAHEEVVPVEQLYEYCRMAREILQGEHGVGRVIARPFTGPLGGPYTRTPRRHDFSLLPPSVTMLDQLSGAGKAVISIGKSRISLPDRALLRLFLPAATRRGLSAPWNIWTKPLKGSALSIWWTMTCFTGTGGMWTATQRPWLILTGGCRS